MDEGKTCISHIRKIRNQGKREEGYEVRAGRASGAWGARLQDVGCAGELGEAAE